VAILVSVPVLVLNKWMSSQGCGLSNVVTEIEKEQLYRLQVLMFIFFRELA